MKINDLGMYLQHYDPERIIFVGLGNQFRGDDAAGLHLIREIRKTKQYNDSVFIEAGLNPENYISQLLEFEPRAIIFTDASRWGGKPGEIKLIHSSEIEEAGFSTHSYSIKLIEEFILKFLKVDFYYLGIEPFETSHSRKLSQSIINGINDFIAVNEEAR
jgi:hydrogenase 3 maturation protease